MGAEVFQGPKLDTGQLSLGTVDDWTALGALPCSTVCKSGRECGLLPADGFALDWPSSDSSSF